MHDTRVAHLSGHIGDLVARVAEADVDACLRMLCISVVDIVELGGEASLRETLTQWREQGRVSPTVRAQLATAITRNEVDAAVAHRGEDVDAQRIAFARARALTTVLIAVDPEAPWQVRLGECVYEAVAALGGTAAVVAVLVEFVV